MPVLFLEPSVSIGKFLGLVIPRGQRVAYAFRVTWFKRLFEAFPGRASRILHGNAFNEKAREDAVQGLGITVS